MTQAKIAKIRKPSTETLRRFVRSLVEKHSDWQKILEETKDEFNLPVTDDTEEMIMDILSDCEDLYAMDCEAEIERMRQDPS